MEKAVFYDQLEAALSLERFSRYLDWSDGARGRAIELYTLNTAVSESLYTPLQMLEVTLRNRIHAVMTEARHEGWFYDEGVLLGQWQPEQRAKAVAGVEADRKVPTPGRIVAALTLSFWIAMFGKDYETLWQRTLHRIAKRPDGRGFAARTFPLRSRKSAPCGTAPPIMNRSSCGTCRSAMPA